MDNLKPSQMMHIGGGLVIVIGSFLDWFGAGDFGVNGWDTDQFGLLGILVALIGAVLAIGGLLTASGNDENMPDQVLGLSRNQLHLALGFAVFVPMFGLQFASNTKFGITLGWIGAALVVAAAIMEQNEADSPAEPTQF